MISTAMIASSKTSKWLLIWLPLLMVQEMNSLVHSFSSAPIITATPISRRQLPLPIGMGAPESHIVVRTRPKPRESLNTLLFASSSSSGTTQEGVLTLPTKTNEQQDVTTTIPTADKKPFSTTLLGTILRKLVSPFRYLQRALFRAATRGVATFLTAVMEDPSCNQAFATVIMRGCNMVLTSKKLKERLVVAQSTLSNNDPSLAKVTGEDFFKILLNFLVGLVDPDLEYSKSDSDDDGPSRDGNYP